MTAVEEAVEKVTKVSEPLAGEDVDIAAMSVDDMTKHSGALEAAVKSAREVLDTASETLKEKRKEMGTSRAAVLVLRKDWGPMNMKLLNSKKSVDKLDQI